MKTRQLPTLLSVFAATLSIAPLVPAHAQDPGTPPPPPPPRREGGFGALPDQAPPGDRFREGGSREGGSREGGPREGGPAGAGVPRGNGMRAGESVEQYQARVLKPYMDALPDLTETQKTHILVIIACINLEATAISNNTTLSQERRVAVGRALRASTPQRVMAALTEAQAKEYQSILDDRTTAVTEMAQLGTIRREEGFDDMRARVAQGYEEFFEEIGVKQKTEILKILEAAGESTAAVKADTAKTPAQKSAALLAIHNDINAKVLPLLDDEQKAAWKKAHDARKPK